MEYNNIVIQALLIVGVFVVLYLSLVRPQQLRLQRHRMMIANLRPGDQIATAGGIVATIIDVNDRQTVTVKAGDNIHLTIIRNRIDQVLLAGDRHASVDQNTAVRTASAG
jgi:preprotein translocase subunit YajC